MDPAAAAAAEGEEGREKPPVIYTMENKPIVTCECAWRPRTGVNGRRRGGAAMAVGSGAGGPGRCPAPGSGEGRPGAGSDGGAGGGRARGAGARGLCGG